MSIERMLLLQQAHHCLCHVQSAIRELEHASKSIRQHDNETAAQLRSAANALGPQEWLVRKWYLDLRDEIAKEIKNAR